MTAWKKQPLGIIRPKWISVLTKDSLKGLQPYNQKCSKKFKSKTQSDLNRTGSNERRQWSSLLRTLHYFASRRINLAVRVPKITNEVKGSAGFIHVVHLFSKNRTVIECNLVYFHQFSRLSSRNLVWSKFSSPASCSFCKEASNRAAASGRVSSWEFGLRLSGGGRSERSFLRLWSARKRRPCAPFR